MNSYIEKAENSLLHTYNRFQVVFEHGQGVYLYDTEGKKYLDFCGGIAVNALGYGDQELEKELIDALSDQIRKVTHTSNYFYNIPAAEAAQKLTKAAGLERVFFTNSGAEAVEGLIKTARKYAYLKDGNTDHEIIAMEHSFHGRTMGALSVTGNPAYRKAFEPMIGNVKFATMNDYESVEALVNEKTCAILLETVQGEGGIFPAEEGFLKKLRKLCDEKDILLIFDEIQCGMGRTGELFAWQRFGVKPDAMATAKALGCGIPVGAFLMSQKLADASLVAGDHGTTYGGNPLACRAVSTVLDLYEKRDILSHVKKVGAYLEEKLDGLVAKYDHIIERRGIGLMQGLEFDCEVKPVLQKALDNGLVLINAGAKIIRFVPPLVITEEDIDEMIRILEDALS
ncbi:MAG: aspartate aminotransferase family protein [Lachnospiraceae bacterium]|nr:aspartate aminotransferase family protein [Lachnospiraceae bacterium]